MGRLIEGLWDCRQCGKTGIRGSIRECPSCGKPRDQETQFYLPGEKRYVPDKEAVKINRNPNWVCLHCGEQLNSDNDKFCKSCGAPRGEENPDYFTAKEKLAAKKAQREALEDSRGSENISREEESHRNGTAPRVEYTTVKIKRRVPNLKVILSILLALVLVSGLIFVLIPKTKELTVLDISWERSINIERYQTVDENDWSVPAGGRLQYTRSEIHHYDQVIDHYETKTRQVSHSRVSGYETYVSGYRDLGNGYFEEITSTRPVYETYYETETYQDPVYRDEPVYRTKYYYEIEKWLYERKVDSYGMDKYPFWGKTNLKKDERTAETFEKYSFTGIDKDDKKMTINLGFEEWDTIEVSSMVKVTVDIFGNGTLTK